MTTIIHVMQSLADRYRTMLADLSQRVRLLCVETANGRYIRIVTGSGIPVATLSRELATEAGIGPHNLQPKPNAKRPPPATIGNSHSEHCTSRQEACMPSIEPVRWAHPDTAPDALRQLLDRGGGRVVNVIVQR